MPYFWWVAPQHRRQFLKLTAVGAGALMTNSLFAQSNGNSTPTNATCLLPDRLRKGDKVAILGLAGALWNKDSLPVFKRVLENLGLVPSFAPSVYKHSGYLSGTDEERLTDLKESMLNPEIKAIFFSRGGWGCARLLEKIDWDWFRKNPKIIIGFSDITYLLNAITQTTGLVTFHGPMGNSGWNEFTISAMQRTLFDATPLQLSEEVKRLSVAKNNELTAVSGSLVGGNLCVFTSMLGSPFFPNCKGKILFLEEIGEEPYRIDRMLTSLKLAGVFDQINGVLLGQFNDCNPSSPDQSFSLMQVFIMHFAAYDFPVFYDFPFGHTVNKWSIPLGVELEFDSKNGALRYVAPALK